MINALRKDDSTTIIDSAEIKQEVAEHFKQRWNCTSTLSASSSEQYLADIPTITESYEYTPIDSLITKDEIKLAINSLNPNTSPGSDGLTPKFYQTFQTQLIPTLHQLYNNMFIQQQAPSSHKTAIVKLIPKPGKSTDIRNWRPISLLNCDYKILAKIITFRLLPFLENYISQTQQAAMKGRQLHNVLLNIKSAIDYVNDISHPLALLQLDFAKAFDNVSHKFILSLMRHINLPPALIQWTTILLQDISAKILVNHTLTDRIPITTGIRQGCPLSMLLFSVATDVLSKKISSSSSIKGLSLGSASMKLQQYADDTILFLTDPSEVNPALQLIQDFSSHANLRINRKKTIILSNNKHLSDEIKKHLPEAKYPNEAKILGIRFSLIFSTLKQNWSRLTGIIKGIADSHNHRNLSMHGKLLLIKTLLLPHITFTARVFQCPRKTQISISKILHKFLWSPSYFEPISRITLSKIPQHGGIGMPSSSAWTNTAFLIRFKSLIANPTPNLFWMSYALYNLSYRIRSLYPEMFSNSMPHKPDPNSDWKHILFLLRQLRFSSDQWNSITHKQLYLSLLDSKQAELPKINSCLKPSSWSEVLLLSKPFKNLSNKQQEVTFKVAHFGYFFGKFNSRHGINRLTNGEKRINTCKFCSSLNDTIEHVCYDCPISRLILLRLQNFIRDKICTNVILSKPLILFNVCNQPASYKTFILKATSIFRVVVLEQKILLDISNQVLAKKNAFILTSCERIFSELNNLIKTEFPFLPAQCSGVT